MDIVANNLSTDVLKARLVLVNGKDVVEYFEEVLDTRLSAGVKFVGEYDSLEVAPKVNGGIVIVKTKDYIYSETQGKWHEIGDEGQIGVLTQAVQALSNSLSDYQPAGDYALKSDIPTAAEISADIHLSDYALTSDISDVQAIKQDVAVLRAVSSEYQLTAEAGSMAYEDKDDIYTILSGLVIGNDINVQAGLSTIIGAGKRDQVVIGKAAQSTKDATVVIGGVRWNNLTSNAAATADAAIAIGAGAKAAATDAVQIGYSATANNSSASLRFRDTVVVNGSGKIPLSSLESLSAYSLASHNHDGTYLKEVPAEYKTYDATVSSLSTDGYASTESLTAYAKTSDLSDIPTIKQDIVNLGAVSSDFQLTAEAGSMAYESKDNYLSAVPNLYKTYNQTKSDLSNDGYALKTDIPSAAEISTDIHLSDYIKEIPNTYKTYVETASSLSNDGYALKSDIPSADDISSEINLSDYSLTSHNHDGTYLKEVPVEYKTYDNTVSNLSASGYALKQWVENKLSVITANIDALSSLVTAANNSLETILNESL